MSISSSIKVKFVFKNIKSAIKLFNHLSEDNGVFNSYIDELSFKRINKNRFVVYLDSRDRDCLFLKWCKIKSKNIDDSIFSKIKGYDKEFCAFFILMGATYKCAVEYILTSEYGVQYHTILDYEENIILTEENEINEKTGKHSNPKFNKKNIETLLLK